jgi:hypothetical protein
VNHQPLGVVTVHGGKYDGERFVTPLDGLLQNTVIHYLDGRYILIRDPASGRWRASPMADRTERPAPPIGKEPGE